MVILYLLLHYSLQGGGLIDIALPTRMHVLLVLMSPVFIEAFLVMDSDC